MSLTELVSYTQDTFADFDSPARPRRRPPQEEELGRPPVPPWLDPLEVQFNERVRLDGDGYFIDIPETGVDSSAVRIRRPQFGADALAYYLPFHFYEEQWGIYIWSDGILCLAGVLKGNTRILPVDGPLLRLAGRVLLEHERLHFMVEVAAARAQMVARTSLYPRYFRSSDPALREEALANAWAVRLVENETGAGVLRRLQEWMKAQGPGYRDFLSFAGRSAFPNGQIEAVGHILASTHMGYSQRDLGPADYLFSNSSRLSVPIYLLLEPWGIFSRARPFPKDFGMRVLVHTEEHPPPHYHIEMPPNEPLTRYTWHPDKPPPGEPLPGDPSLSKSEQKRLLRYWEKYGDAIEKKLRQVFQPATAFS